MAGIVSVIFDLDGTLLDTLDDLAAAINYAVQKQGYPPHSRDAVRSFVGNGAGTAIRRALPLDCDALEHTKTLASFREYYQEHRTDATRPYDGIEKMLADIQARGIRVAVVSNKADENVKALCQAYFGIEIAVGDQEGMPRKPAPDGVAKAMEQMGADVDRTVYVGDSEVDVETARNAGIPCLAVTWGFRSAQELRAAGATRLVDTPAQLADIILQEWA